MSTTNESILFLNEPHITNTSINKSGGDRKTVHTVIIKEGVTTIGEGAFEDCVLLTTVIIPGSVTIIGERAFEDCVRLEDIIIPNGVKSIGNRAFNECWSLETVIIPDSVTAIGTDAFGLCSELKTVVIGKGVTKIYNSFAECGKLKELYIHHNILTKDLIEIVDYEREETREGVNMGFKILYNVQGVNFHMSLDNVYVCRAEQPEELINEQFKTFRTKQLSDEHTTLEPKILSNEAYEGKIGGIIKGLKEALNTKILPILKQALNRKIGEPNLDEKLKTDILSMISKFEMTGGRRITDPKKKSKIKTKKSRKSKSGRKKRLYRLKHKKSTRKRKTRPKTRKPKKTKKKLFDEQ
jgi:hypothetical protein